MLVHVAAYLITTEIPWPNMPNAWQLSHKRSVWERGVWERGRNFQVVNLACFYVSSPIVALAI